MHKNTLLLVSLLAVISALLIGINIGRTISQPASDSSASVTAPVTTPTPTLTYLSGSACGISFQYPNTLTPMESSTSGMILADTAKPDASVVIICQSDIPGVSLTPEDIEQLTIMNASGSASVSARLYHDTSAKDNTPIDKVIFTHPKTKLDVFLGGFGPVFNRIVASVKIL